MLLIKDYIKELEEELHWLRYFYSEARHAMGPADSDIYAGLKEDYINEGNNLPDGYKDEE